VPQRHFVVAGWYTILPRKISIKSAGLDLEIDSVEKLEDVLEFVTKFKELELRTEAEKLKVHKRYDRQRRPKRPKKS
jgi:hypothetical protein